MSKLLLRFFTCNLKPKDKDVKYRTSNSMPALVTKGTQEGDLGLIPDVELCGYSKKGSGPGKTECQDTYYLHPKLGHSMHFFAVYDGHGPKGRDVSSYVNEQIAKHVRKDSEKLEKMIANGKTDVFFKNVFKIVDKKLHSSSIESYTSGTTCLGVLLYRSKCFIINLGDSRAVLCRKSLTGESDTIELSEDHKPTRPDEKERIIKSGGIIESAAFDGSEVGPLRVWTKSREGGIAMTRSMGDDQSKSAGLTSEPEVTQYDLQQNDRFIIAATDGLWDVMASEEAVEFVLRHLKEGKPKNLAARKLASEAKKRWGRLEENENDPDPYCDDITVVVAFNDYLGEPLDTQRK